jgi:hypothetical protein
MHFASVFADPEPMEAQMSIFPTFASTAASPHRTRFVLVNDRVPREGTNCALCGRKIEKGYVRESQTRLLYCETQCVPERAEAPMIALKIARGKYHEVRTS